MTATPAEPSLEPAADEPIKHLRPPVDPAGLEHRSFRRD
jgi:hypothetical protein